MNREHLGALAALDGVEPAFALWEQVVSLLEKRRPARVLEDWSPPFPSCFIRDSCTIDARSTRPTSRLY